MNSPRLESILVVYQNPVEGRLSDYDDWYTNVHIRDAMRLDGAIATQRFVVHRLQPVMNGRRATPIHWAHTIYEWESAEASVRGHAERGGTPLMEITRDASFRKLRDYFFVPCYMSGGWRADTGFRGGSCVLTVLIEPAGDPAGFAQWFESIHAPSTLAMPGFASAGLFALHDVQSLPVESDYPMVAIYGLSDAAVALEAWNARNAGGDRHDIAARAARYEAGCWEPRTERLRASAVLNPAEESVREENRARQSYADRYLTQAELGSELGAIADSWLD